jgi:hypothetical protein
MLCVMAVQNRRRVCLRAGLVLTAVASCPAAAQHAYTAEQVIGYAKSIDVRVLDPALPSEPLESWLRSGPPHLQRLNWTVAATCDLKPDFVNIDYPLCAKIWIDRGKIRGFFLVYVGTESKGIEGSPHLGIGADLWMWDKDHYRNGGAERLSQLPSALNELEKPENP